LHHVLKRRIDEITSPCGRTAFELGEIPQIDVTGLLPPSVATVKPFERTALRPERRNRALEPGERVVPKTNAAKWATHSVSDIDDTEHCLILSMTDHEGPSLVAGPRGK